MVVDANQVLASESRVKSRGMNLAAAPAPGLLESFLARLAINLSDGAHPIWIVPALGAIFALMVSLLLLALVSSRRRTLR